MHIEIDCPAGGDKAVVATPGLSSCSGSVGTICVKGQLVAFLFQGLPLPLAWLLNAVAELVRWVVNLLRGRPRRLALSSKGLKVQVRVLSGHVSAPSSSASVPCDAIVNDPGTTWCARPVPVPGCSASGADLTVVAWLLDSSGGVVYGPIANFFSGYCGGGSGLVDCCSGCSSGSGSHVLAGELASAPALEVAVPDGPRAGLHRATAVSPLTWAVSIGGVTYQVSCGPGAALLIRGPSASAAATAVEGEPFSATFPGSVFGAAGDVVVTTA